MSSVIETIERAQLRRVPDFSPGDRVKVHFQVVEGTRRRVQIFEGVVIKRQGHGARETFTVRKHSFGVGVERTFPLHSPKIERIEIASRGDVRRAKLYYLRDRVGKRARVRERRYMGPEEAVEPGLLNVLDEQLEGEQAEGEQVDGESMPEGHEPSGDGGGETAPAEAGEGETEAAAGEGAGRSGDAASASGDAAASGEDMTSGNAPSSGQATGEGDSEADAEAAKDEQKAPDGGAGDEGGGSSGPEGETEAEASADAGRSGSGDADT